MVFQINSIFKNFKNQFPFYKLKMGKKLILDLPCVWRLLTMEMTLFVMDEMFETKPSVSLMLACTSLTLAVMLSAVVLMH